MVERHRLVAVDDIVHVGIGLPLAFLYQRVGEIALATTVAPYALSPPVVLHLCGIDIVGVHHAVGGIEREVESRCEEVGLLVAQAGN